MDLDFASNALAHKENKVHGRRSKSCIAVIPEIVDCTSLRLLCILRICTVQTLHEQDHIKKTGGSLSLNLEKAKCRIHGRQGRFYHQLNRRHNVFVWLAAHSVLQLKATHKV